MRANVNADHYNVAATYDAWDAPSGYRGLTSGGAFFINSHRVQVDGQTNWSLRQDSVQVVAGAVVVSERFTSADPETGAEAFLSGPVALDKQALFGQAAWSITEQLRLVLVGRSDWSSLHSAQLSPKASLIYSFVPDQSVRFTYNRAFQSPNVAEFFLEFPVAPPAPLGGLNAFCTPFGVDCGFGDTPILARGNADLDAETIRTWEVGYKGVLPGGRF